MSAKKENDAKTTRNSSMPATVTKKIQAVAPFKPITWQMRNGGKQRDVGTHIRYQGDGKNLSLMEMDILKTTGCKWSKIIFPGFKGYLKPHEKDMMHRSPIIDPKIEGFLSQSSADKGLTNFMESFNKEYSKIVDGSANSGLRNSVCSRGKSQTSETNLKIGMSPFSNELLQQQIPYNQFENLNGSAIKSLQQKIMDTNFNEPKSLVSSLAGRANALNASSSKKKRLIGMGLPFDYSDQKIKFNLEVVQERTKATIELSDKKSNFKSNPQLQDSVTKKIRGGVIIDGSTELRQKKSSFANVG